MTLDEAIKHCEEKIDCTECGKQHKQLMRWLKELQLLRKMDDVDRYIYSLRKKGYVVKKWTKAMERDADECVSLDERGQSKDCGGCSCSVCLMNGDFC